VNRSRREGGWLVALLLGVAAVHLCWCALDRRPPNDHDDAYTGSVVDRLVQWESGDGQRRRQLLHASFSAHNPLNSLMPSTLLVTTATVGASRFTFRASNLPYLLLLVFGTWLVARELEGPRLALLAAAVVATLPIVLNGSHKLEPQFHAAALTPVGLWLALRALRQRSGGAHLGLWLTFAAWQWVRLHSHAIVVPDVAATCVGAVVATLVLAHRDGRPLARRLAPLIVGLVVLLGASWGLLFGEGEVSWLSYLGSKGEYTRLAGLLATPPGAHVASVAQLGREVVSFHLFVLPAALLLGGLAGLPLLLGRSDPARPTTPVGHWLLTGTLAIQLPALYVAYANGALSNDWAFVVPSLVILGLAGLRALSVGSQRWVRVVGVTLLLAHGAAVATLPLVAPGVLPDPLSSSTVWRAGPLHPLVHSVSGHAYNTMMIPVQTEIAGTALAEALATAVGADPRTRGEERPALHIDVHDLSWAPSAESCADGRAKDDQGWRWAGGTTSGPDLWRGKDADYSGWPFLFAGLAPPQLRLQSGPVMDRGPDLFSVVRLWVAPNARCPIEPDFLHDAIRSALASAGPRAQVDTLGDPSRWLLGTRMEFDSTGGYLGGALLVRWTGSGRFERQ